MTTNERFGTLTIKNNGEPDVTQNCILNLGVNVIGSSVNANVRLHDTNIDQQHCIVEVKEDGLVTVAALHIFPQTKINNLALLKNRKVVLKNGDVLKISNTEITYNNDSSRTYNQAGITKQIKQKIFPFNTPRRRSCNLTSSSAKKAPTSVRFGAINKQSLFSPSPLIVKKNLPPKHNDDWPSQPLDHDQFPFVGHFSPQKQERPLQYIPEALSELEDIIIKPSSPSLVNVVVPTVRTSVCTSTSDFDKIKNEETMIPDVKSEISINSNDTSLKSFYKPTVCVPTCLSGRKSSLPAQNTNPNTSRRQSRSSSCVTPTKASLHLKSRLTCSEHKLSNESQPSFLQSESIEMENSTISPRHENSELNSSTPTSAVRTSTNLTLLDTPTSIIKKRDSMLNKSTTLNKMDKTNNMDTSEAREKSKSRLFDQSLESVDGDSLAVSTDTSSFVYESALAVLPSVDNFEVEEIVEDFQVSVAPASKSLNSPTIAPNDSDISGIASLASTPERKSTISNDEMMISHVDIGESISNQTDISYESTVSVQNDEDTFKDSQSEQVQNYSSITISSNENLDTSDAGSLNSDLIDLREASFEKSEDEMEEIRRDSKRRMSLDIEPQCEASYSKNNMHRLSQILNIDEQRQETPKSNNSSQRHNTEEEVILVNVECQSSAVQIGGAIGTRSSARKSKMFQVTDEETNSSSMQAVEDESGNGSSLILAIDQEDETTEESSVIEKKVDETFTLTETAAKMTENFETFQTTEVLEFDNSEIEGGGESLVTEEVEIVPERKSKRISLRQGTPVASGNTSTRKSKIYQLPVIHLNDQTIEINDSEDTDASTASENKSKRYSKLLRTPVKNSPVSSEVRSTRKSKIHQTPNIELNDSEDTDDASTTSDSKSNRNEKLLQTPVKNSPAVPVVRSTRKSSIQTSYLQEGLDCNTPVQIFEDTNTSVTMQTPLIQGSLIAFGDRSSKKSQVLQTPLLKEDEIFGFEDSEDSDSSLVTENTSSIERSSVAADANSKIVETPLCQDDNAVEIQDVVVATDRKSKRISKILQTSLIPDSPRTSQVGLTRKSKDFQTAIINNEDSESSDSESVFTENKTPSVQQTPVVDEVRSTRKSKIVQTPSLQDDKIVESEDISASCRKSKRISNVLKTPSVSNTPITSGVGSTRKSKIFQTTLLEDEEVSDSEDAEELVDSVLTKNKSRRTSSLLQISSMQLSPAVAEVRSTRKSKIVQTPLLPDENIVKPEDITSGTERKSKRISKALQTPSISDLSDTSEVDSTTKSQVLATSILQDQAVDSNDSENIDDLVSTENNTPCESTILQASSLQCTPASQAESTRKSKIDQTPSLLGDEIVASEDIHASGRKSRRISNIQRTSSASNTPISSVIGSTRKSKVLQTPLLEKEETSESEDMNDSLLIEDQSKRTSTLLQTPSMSSPAVANVRSTRKSKIVQTPTLPDDKIVEPKETLATTDRKSKRISKVLQTSSILDSPDISEVDSTTKSQVSETSEESDSDTENTDDLVSTENYSRRASTVLQESSIQRTPVTVEVRSTRKSKIDQTPSLQGDEIVESKDISASGRKSRRISNILKTPSVSGTPITFGVGSTRKSKVLQTPLLEKEETSKSEDMNDSLLIEDQSKGTSTLLQTPSMSSPAVANVRSTRKSKIVQTPTLPDDKIVEPKETLATTDRKSKRISKVLQTSSILDSPDISEVDSTTKSQVFETSEESDSDTENTDDLVSTENYSRRASTVLQESSIQRTPVTVEVRSTRKSKIDQTPSLQGDEIVESEDISASGRKSRRISNILKTPSVSGTPITSGVGSTRKSKVLQTPLLDNVDASQSKDVEDKDGSLFTENESRCTSALLQTPSMQRSPAVAEIRSTRKSKIVEYQDIVAGTERKSMKIQTSSISDSLETSKDESQILETSVLQDETYDSNGSEDMDDSVFADNNSRRKSSLVQTESVQCTPTAGLTTSLQGDEIVESEDIFASGRKSRRISNVLKTPSVSGTPITSGVVSARKSKIFQAPLLEDEEDFKLGDAEEMDNSILTKNKSLLQTPSMQPSPAIAEVRSTRKSKIVPTPSLRDDIEGNTDEEADQSGDTSPIAANKSRTSKLPLTPLVQSSPASSGIRSVRKSKILNTPLLQNEEIADRKSKRIFKVMQTSSIPNSLVPGDDTEGSTNAVAVDALDTPANESSTFLIEFSAVPTHSSAESADSEDTVIETDRKSKRISKIPSLQNTPTASGVTSTRKSKILQTPLSENEATETETLTLLQTPSTNDLPSTSGIRSTRKSKVSKTPLLNNKVNAETEEMDTPVNKSKLLLTPQSSPVVSGVRSTQKSKISVTPVVTSAIQTRRGSKAPQTPMIQEEANTSTKSASKSKRTSQVLQTNLDNTPGTSGIQVKRTSKVLKTPSMQDFNQTNSGIKSKRISKLQQTPLIQEETIVSGRKSATPKNIEKSKTPVSSAIKRQRISTAFGTSSLIDFEEIESPLTSPVKSRNTSKVLTFNTPTDKDDSESEVETSPAPKRRKVGGRTANTEPSNDLTNVQGVKTLFKTPKVQKQPHNDLTDVRGVKNILKTPKAVKEPTNDLTNVEGLKKLMATPKVQNSPANDLTNVGGVKKLLKTPRAPKEPHNDLTDIQGVKKLMATPTKQKSPKNDLSDVRGVKQLIVTPKPRKSTNLSGLGDFFASTSKTTTPKHGLSEVRGVKKILDIKKSKKSLKVQNSPKNDLTNVVGVKKMFADEEAEYNRDFNVSGVAEIMNKSDELFNSLLDKKPLKTYGRKSTPVKLDDSVNIGVVSGTPVLSEEVVNWVNTQDFNKGEVVDNLTPIKSKNNENLAISKKQDVAIHSSTPLNKGNRGILKEIEANIHQDTKSNDAINDKNLKKVQFLDDSNLRKSNRTRRTPSKIATEFVMTSSKSHKRKADQDEHFKSAKVPKMVSESNNASVIIIDSETDQEDPVKSQVSSKKGAKKVPKTQLKKPTRANSNSDKVEEESVDNNEKVEAPKTTRSRAIRKTNKKVVEVENDEEINASNEEKIENENIEAPKTTRSRSGKKTNAKTTKKVEKPQIENNEEIKTSEKVEENFDQNDEIEAPKTTRSRNLKKTNVKTSNNENSIEEIEAPKTRRGRALQKTNTKTVKQMEKVDSDENSDNEEAEVNEKVEVPKTTRGRSVKQTNTKASKKVEKVENSTNEDEEIEMPESTRGRATKKTSAKNLKTSLTEENNESLKKTTRSRKVTKKPEPEKQFDSSVEVLSDEENDEPVFAVPKKTRGRPASKTIEEVQENIVDEEIDAPKTTRGRAVKKTSAKTSKKSVEENLKANLTEENNESLQKTTRSRKVTKKPEPEKQFDSSVEILSDEEKDESAIEVQKTTRSRAASKTNKKVTEKNTRQRAAPKGKKVVEVETSINSTLESSKARVEETSVTLPKTKRTRGIKRSLEVESLEEQENSITANSKKNSKKLKSENVVIKKTSESRVRGLRTNKNSIENSEMEESKNEETNKAVRGRKTKAEVQLESKSEEEESKGAKTRGKRKLYSLDDSVKIDVEEVVEVKKVPRTRNAKEKVEVVAPVRSSKRTRK